MHKPLPRYALILPSALLLGLSAPASAGLFSGPDNYYECVLEQLDGTKDDIAAINSATQCRNEFPETEPFDRPDPPLFGPENLRECLEEYLAETSSPYAVNQISDACFQLYPDTGADE